MEKPLSFLSIQTIFGNFPNKKRSELKHSIPSLRSLHPPKKFKSVTIHSDALRVALEVDDFKLKLTKGRPIGDVETTKIRKTTAPNFAIKEFFSTRRIHELLENFVEVVLNRADVTIKELNIEGSVDVLKYFGDNVHAQVLHFVYNTDNGYLRGSLLKFSILPRISIFGKSENVDVYEDVLRLENQPSILYIRADEVPIDVILQSTVKYMRISENNVFRNEKFLKVLKKFCSGAHVKGSYYKGGYKFYFIDTTPVIEQISLDYPAKFQPAPENWQIPEKLEWNRVTIDISEKLAVFVGFEGGEVFCKVIDKKSGNFYLNEKSLSFLFNH